MRSTHSPDGAIVLDLRRGQIFHLNLIGSRILELLKTGTTEAAIADTISKEFEVNRNLVEADLRDFLEALQSCQLVEQEDSTPTI